jgi:putative addiction module component (TIGR02574 family)
VSARLDLLQAEAQKLTPEERAKLLVHLIASLDADEEIEEAWAKEADRRAAELDSGAVVAISGDEMMARLRSRLG